MAKPTDISQADLRPGSSIKELPGIGTRMAQRLARLEIHTLGDLIRHLPMRYEQEQAEGAIADLTVDFVGSARGTVVACRWIPGGRAKGRFEATLEDHSDRLHLTWFNAAYLRDKLRPGMVVRVQGKVGAFRGYPQMVNPRWERLDDADQTAPRPDRVRPVYPATEDLPSSRIEQFIEQALPIVLGQLVDPLPAELVRNKQMPLLADAFAAVHQPADLEQAAAGRRRLAYNELLLLQLGMAIKRHYNRTMLRATALNWSPAIDEHIRQRFGFELTESQNSVVGDIARDMQQPEPMNRLLQGDVGSGKTVVALYALLLAVANRKQGALMAPTELLAEQHHLSIASMLEGSNVRIALLTGSLSASDRRAMLKAIESGDIDLVIGTQALLTESVRFSDLAVVVVDEQHRFGVLQRASFRSRADANTSPAADQPRRSPHYLVMTATPIPRTLSLTIFGDLDVSIIRHLPPGRSPIVTRVVGQDKADDVYAYLGKRVSEGRQAYVVVPTIDEQGAAAAGQQAKAVLKNVQAHVKLLKDKLGPAVRVAAVHGRLKPETRESIMQRFRRGDIDVLVATTVIEVGVDVPNATVMVVEHAERFGLAQLHQLRGRVGRGSHGHKSVCVFIAEATTEQAQQRMAAIAGTSDGFKIAEQDLHIRGMGDFFGTRQHGLPPLRVARFPDEMDLLLMARRDADELVRQDPHLAEPAHQILRKILLQQYGQTLGLIDVG